MRLIRLDCRDRKDRQSEFEEVSAGKIVLTDACGLVLLHARGWRCGSLIVVRPDPSIRLEEINSSHTISVQGIAEGIERAWGLHQGNIDLVVLCYNYSKIGHHAFNICRGTDNPQGTYAEVKSGESPRRKQIKSFFWALRRKRNETFGVTATAIGIHQSKLSQIINGRHYPSRALREKIAEAFGIDCEEIHAVFSNYHPTIEWVKVDVPHV